VKEESSPIFDAPWWRYYELIILLQYCDDSQMQTNMNELVSYYLGSMEPNSIDILIY
jgi:hypothetical protein